MYKYSILYHRSCAEIFSFLSLKNVEMSLNLQNFKLVVVALCALDIHERLYLVLGTKFS